MTNSEVARNLDEVGRLMQRAATIMSRTRDGARYSSLMADQIDALDSKVADALNGVLGAADTARMLDAVEREGD